MNPVPPKIDASSSFNRRVLIIIAVSLALAAGILFFFNPATHRFYPVCQFHRLTGLNCPGCGMTRAAYALLHGEFSAAIRDNALLVGLGLLLVLRGAWFGWNRFRRRPNGQFFPARWLWMLLALALIFTVLRNLPAFAFLSP